jgi:hexosaminidase
MYVPGFFVEGSPDFLTFGLPHLISLSLTDLSYFSNSKLPYMKKLFAFLSLIAFGTLSAQQQAPIHIIPAPSSVIMGSGELALNRTVTISSEGEGLQQILKQFEDRLLKATSIYLNPVKTNGQLQFTLLSSPDTALGSEGYRLSVSTENMKITANTTAGLFYGIQSFFQLLPKETESNTALQVNKKDPWKIPVVAITDKPRFGWRGLMFDVSRHFFTKQEVKQFIDDMVRYKFNLLHLHLTDDQGWRIQIKSLPQLTDIGAWRPLREGKWANSSDPAPDEPKTYGGFYTHDDIRELVQYAKERFVNILPEVDIPGHSMAMLASIPGLSATPGTKYWVNAGEKFMEWPAGAHFYALKDNNLSPANEKVYEVLDKVFTEIAQLFPFEYIHMGGDETAKNFWEKSDEIKALMKRENLKDMDAVQSYFVKRVEKIISSKGKKMMGWDEILEGGLAEGASVMSWRGMKGGIAAAKANHKVVMSPTDFAYLDYYQGEKTMEPPVYAGLRLQKAYQFDPLPDSIDAKFILGGQGNLWTEQLQNFRAIQYMLWPRAMAIAESVWSPKVRKNWPDFINRVEHHFERLNFAKIRYSTAMYDPIITARYDEKGNLVLLVDKEIPDMAVHFSIDESNPDYTYRQYLAPFTLPKDVANVKFVCYRNGKQVGRQINISVEELKKRVTKR